MRFSTHPHRFSCGIARHARTMDVCSVSHAGARLVHRTMPAAPAPFLQAVPPSREGLVVAVACLCTWYGLADRCADQALPFGLGHALSRPASQGGQANNDPSAAHKIAALLRGGRLPQASSSPAAMRSPRARLRRRTPLRRQRAARLAHVHNPHAQDHVPDLGKHIASQAHREGVAERLNDPAVPQTLAVDLARMPSDAAWRRAVALARVHTAKPHAAPPLSWRPTVPGIGHILRLVLRYAIHDLGRFPRGQDVAASARLVPCSHASAGTRGGTSGKPSGNAPLTWALSEAAPVCLRHHPHGPKRLTRLENNQGTGQALPLLAHPCARAVSDMLQRHTACDMAHCLRPSRSRAGEPGAALDPHGLRLPWHAPSPVRRRLSPRRGA